MTFLLSNKFVCYRVFYYIFYKGPHYIIFDFFSDKKELDSVSICYIGFKEIINKQVSLLERMHDDVTESD